MGMGQPDASVGTLQAATAHAVAGDADSGRYQSFGAAQASSAVEPAARPSD
jgi:hypothetical protein